LAPFLGARDTATIHPLFLGLKLFTVSLNRSDPWLYYKLSTALNAHPYWLI
jgi:IS1 family transposase